MIAQGTSCDYFERPWRVDLQMRGFSFSTLLTSYMARFQAGSRGSTSLSKSAFLFSKIALITLHNVETSSPPWGRGLNSCSVHSVTQVWRGGSWLYTYG